jgi:hypothetical protein
MNNSLPYMIFTIVTMVLLAMVFLLKKTDDPKFTPLASLAFTFVLAGIVFSENRITGYGMLLVGISLAIADLLNKSKAGQE